MYLGDRDYVAARTVLPSTAIKAYIAPQTANRSAAMAEEASRSMRARNIGRKREKGWERDDLIGQVDSPDHEKLRENDRQPKHHFCFEQVV